MLCWPAKWPGETEEAGGTMEKGKIWQWCQSKGMKWNGFLDVIWELTSPDISLQVIFFK